MKVHETKRLSSLYCLSISNYEILSIIGNKYERNIQARAIFIEREINTISWKKIAWPEECI
jgi:hypothetical protein